MDISIDFVIQIIILHFMCDWILQDREVANNKKDNFSSLLLHLFFDIMPMLLCLCLIFYTKYNFSLLACFTYFSINIISHALIDWYLPKGKNERDVINFTALDQILHLFILFYSIEIFNLL